MERAPKKHVVEEFEEFDYSDLYDDISVSTVTAGPNVTEYEVRLVSTTLAFYVLISSVSFCPSSFVCLCVSWTDCGV